MASPALLFLLLVLSSLLLSTMANPPAVTPKKQAPSDQRAVYKGEEFLKVFEDFHAVVTPFLTLFPVGTYIKAFADSLKAGARKIITGDMSDPLLTRIRYDLETLNLKIDRYYLKQKWDIWASGAYQNPEIEINVAWQRYQNSLAVGQKDLLKKELISACEMSQPALYKLHTYLAANQRLTFTENLADMLAEHAKCREQDIKMYSVLILKLIYKGNILNILCNIEKLRMSEVQEILLDQEADVAYESAQAIFQLQKDCVLNSLEYIQREVLQLINDETKHQRLAEEILSFLAANYDRYDWMVVAYTTVHSAHKRFVNLNRHTLYGFIPVTRGKMSVSIARQIKGDHTQADAIKKIIQKCVPPSVPCPGVELALRQCKEQYDKKALSETYTAVHAFIYKSHHSYSGEQIDSGSENPSADTVPQSSYLHTGDCGKETKTGKFVVMIKSDDELKKEDPCPKCVNGECVRVEDSFVAMCECKEPFYGENCDKDYKEDYKKDLKETIEALSGF